MNRQKPRRAPAVVCWLLAGTGLLTACGTSTQPSDAPRRSAVTVAQATAIVQAYDARNNAANAAFDVSGLTTIEAPPLHASSRALMTVSKTLQQEIPEIKNPAPQFIIPAQSGYPRWFLSISKRVIDGVPASQPTYAVYVQAKAAAPYLAAFALTPTDQQVVGPFALHSNGAATPVNSGAGLLVAPADLGSAITRHYLQGLQNKDAFDHSAPLDDVLGNGFDVARQVLGTRGVNLTRNVHSVDPRFIALRTADGGALAFTSVTVRDLLKAKSPKTPASLRAGSIEAAVLGKPSGAKASSFTIDRLEMFMTYIPTKSSGTKAKVLAYSETAVSVK